MLALGILSTALSTPVGPRSLGTLTISEAGLGTLNLALDKTEDPAAAEALVASIAAVSVPPQLSCGERAAHLLLKSLIGA